MRTKTFLFSAVLTTTTWAQWTDLNSGTAQELVGVVMLDPEVVWAFGESGALLRTTDGGTNWTAVDAGFPEDINAMMRYDYLGMLLFCDGGTILRSDDLGETWEEDVPPTSQELVSVTKVGTTAIAVGESGTIIRSIDNGHTWSPMVSGANQDLECVVMSTLSVAVAVGEGGTCLRSADAGLTWDVVSLPVSDDLATVVFVDDQTVLAAGDGGAVLRSTDAGLNWTSIPVAAADELSGLWLDDTDEIYAVGAGGVILRSTDAGLTWDPEEASTAVELLDVSTGYGTGFAVGASGTIIKLTGTVDAIAERAADEGLLLYPNPSAGDFNIALSGSALQGPLTVEVRTSDGRVVDRASTERLVRPARMLGMPPGQYVVTVTDANGLSLRRNLIVQAH